MLFCNFAVTKNIAMKKWIVMIAGAMLLGAINSACVGKEKTKSDAEQQPDRTSQILGQFSADSAYRYITEQLAFGPRVPGSEGHRACRDYIINRLEGFGADSLMIQDGIVTAYDGTKLPITNIIAGYNINAPRRILLAAHWDTRPWADKDHDSGNHSKPVPGANDGASGVAVLLEIARNLAIKDPNVGVDLMFIDAEDYGDDKGFSDNEDTWCLGSQYWIKQGMPPYHPENLPVYGILLDMVGGRDARFYYEYFSQANAANPTIKVWSEAENINHNDRFIRRVGGGVTDDNVFLTRAGIPTTVIIECLNDQTQSFPPVWHTVDDDINYIDTKTLKAVGETVLNVVYKEKRY